MPADKRGRHAAYGTLTLLLLSGPVQAGSSWRERLDLAERLSEQGKNAEASAEAQGVLADAGKDLGPEAPELGGVLARLTAIDEGAGADAQLVEIRERLQSFKSKGFQGWFALGRLLRREQKFLEAEAALKSAMPLDPGNIEAAHELARVYDDTGRFEEELVLLKKVIDSKPKDYFVYSELARTYVRLGRVAEAKSSFARAKGRGGEEAGAYIAEGYFYLHSGHSAEAREAFENAVVVDTSSPYGYHHLGTYLYSIQEYPQAEAALRRALKLEEADPKASEHDRLHTTQWLGDAVEAQGRHDEAEAVFLALAEKAPPGNIFQFTALRSLAKLYASNGKTAKAEAAYERAASLCAERSAGPDCALVYVGGAFIDLGQFYLGQGRRAEAEAMAKRTEQLCAAAPVGARFDVLRDLAVFYARLGDAAKEKALYARLLPLRKKMPDSHDLVWVEAGLARIAADHARFSEADEHYREAIGMLDRTGYWKEEADLLETVAALREREGRIAESAEVRTRAKALRERQ